MSTFGTPEGNGRATQPPLDGPSLATPHRSPFPTSLRPSLFHARSTPLSATYSPVSSTATPVTLAAAAHLQAPRNTPSSAFSSRTTSAPAKNPFERLPASSFDSFVSSVTRRIKSALEPGELPSERRRREREEREKERERARREREEARRRKQEEDVFGDIRALGEEMRGEEAAAGDLSEEQFDSTDFADRLPHHERAAVSDLFPRPHSPSSVVYGHMPSDISLPSTSVSAAPSVAPQDEDEDVLVLSSSAESSTRATPQPEMREVRLGSSHSLFVARATASVSSNDDRGGTAHDTGPDESFGLETGSEDEEEERRAPFDRFDEPMADERRDARDEDAPLILQEDEFDVDAIGEGVEAEEKADMKQDEFDTGEEDDHAGEDEEVARAESRASQSLEREDAEIAEDTPYYRDPFGRPILYAQPSAGENDDEGDAPDYVEDVSAPLDENPRARLESPVDLAADKGQVGYEAIESRGNEGEDYGLGGEVREADGVFGTREEEEEEEEEEASRLLSPHRPSVTETIELGSSSDDEPVHATRQPRPATQDADDRFAEVPQRATYGAEVVESREPFAFEADIDVADYSVDSVRAGGRVEESQAEALEAVHVPGGLSSQPTADHFLAAINDEDAFSADEAFMEAQEERVEEEQVEEVQVEEEEVGVVEQQIVEADDGREFFGEDTPGDEVRQGGEIIEDDEEMENVQVAGRHNPLEALYADEDSEDLGPSIPYEIKGKGRAPPQALEATESGDEIGDDGSDSSIATITSENVDFAIADWMKWAPRIKEYDDDELAEKIFTLSAQLELAMDVESPRQHLIAQQLSDFHTELARRMPTDDEDEVLDPSTQVDSADDAALVADDEQDDEILTTSPDRSAFQQDSASPEPIDANAASRAAVQLDAIASNLVDLFDRGVPSLVQVPQDTLAASEEPRVDAARAVDGLVEADRASSPAAGADIHRAPSAGIDEQESMETSAEARERATPAVKLAEDSSIQPSETASCILAPPETARLAAPAASFGESQRSGSLRTLQHPAFSSHVGEEPGPQPDFASRLRYEMPPTIHRVDSPVRSDSAGPDLPQDGSIRIGVTDEEMLDASLVGRHVPLSQAEAATSAAIRQQEDGGIDSTSGGLLVIDDDAGAGLTPSPPRPQTPVPVATAPKIAGATPPPADQLDDVPTIVDGVAPPQNFDIVPAPLPRSPSPVAHTASAAHRHVASSPKQAADKESPAPPTDASMLTPASLAKTDRAEDLDHISHLQSEIGPQTAFDSRVRYEAPPAIHSVDSPVHEDDGDSEAREDGAVRVGLSDEELQAAMLAGSAPRLDTTDNLVGHDVQEQRDMDVEVEGASAGLVVIDDDVAGDEHAHQQPLSDLRPADIVESTASGEDKGHKLGATPPPSTSVDAQPPIVNGIAPPQNPALLPSTVPRETGLGDFVAFGDTDEDEHDADNLSAADEGGPSLEAPKSPSGTASHILGLPAGEETVVVSNSAETSDDSDEEGVIAVRAAARSIDPGAQAANRPTAERAVESVAEVDIAQQEPTLQPEYAQSDAAQSAAVQIAVKNVVEPGEWNPDDPIEFGTASAGEFASVDVDVALEDERVSQSNEVSNDSSTVTVDGSPVFANGSSPPPAFVEPDETVLLRHAEQDDVNLDEGESTDEEQLVISLVGSSGRNGASSDASLGKEDAGSSASSSAVTAAPQSPSLPGKIPQRLRLSTPLRRSSRLSLPPSPAASTPTQPTSTTRRSRTAEEASSTSANLPSPAKRQRVTDPPKSQDAASPASSRSTGARLHQHRHRPTSAATSSANGVSPPLTRSRCHFSRLRISSREDASAPPYFFNVPTCALASDYAKETMRRFHVENLGDVPDSDDCEGIQLGGQSPSDANAAEVMESRHSALVPHEDVLRAVRRIAGSELWDEGACEVLPREEVEGRHRRGAKRASAGASSADSESGKRRRT